ncbi:hypothetical protein C8R43DRAFT_1007838 [Mycena crocata]|nr:hypothetical protein C8R43DRAFT_1007838 [Mycena crocata]
MLVADGSSLALGLFLVLPTVLSQTTHIVNVGVEGSFFSPATISAGLNDTITFMFGGDFHSVTQSTFVSPCIRLPGGFDSGFAGRGPTFSNPTPVWNLRITNISEPIWFFCQASMPTSHCKSGMVGAINPPSISQYNQFVSAAKLVNGTPAPSPSFLPSGHGAFATNSPMPISTSSPPLSASISSTPALPSSTAAASTTTASAVSASSGSSGANRGLIAGCATAGCVIIIIFVVLAIYHYRRWRLYRCNITPRPAPIGDLNDVFHRDDKAQSPAFVSSPGTASSTAGTHAFPTMPTPPSPAHFRRDDEEKVPSNEALPPRTIRPLPLTPSQNQLHQQYRLAGGDGDRGGGSPYAREESPLQAQHVDMNTLAMEVANVLLQTPPRPGSRQHLDSLRNNNTTTFNTRYDSGVSNETATSAPPHYRPT